MEATAYNEEPASCDKPEEHPEYGITASGTRVSNNRTVAMDSKIPFGTPVFIPYLSNSMYHGLYTVEDRGGAIGTKEIDIYMSDENECYKFGRRIIEVYIPKEVIECD